MQAWAVRQLGLDPERGVYVWWNGFQYTDVDRATGFRVTWIGENGDADAYSGSLRVQYWTLRHEGDASPSLSILKQWVMGPGSPFPAEEWGQSLQGSVAPIAGRRDIGMTVRRAQVQDAKALKEVLEASTRGDGLPLDVFLYIDEGQTTRELTYDSIRKAQVQLLWISDEYLDPSPSNHVTLHEFANAVFTWARSQGLAVNHVHLKELPKRADQKVALIYNDSAAFSFLQDFWDRAHAALESMEQYHRQRVLTLAKEEKDTVLESQYTEKFRAAGSLSKAFCGFYTDQFANQLLLLSVAPATPEESAALAARLTRLLLEQSASADRF